MPLKHLTPPGHLLLRIILCPVCGDDAVYLIPEEEGEQEDTDVGTVHVGIRHDHDAVVPKSGGVELVALGSSQGRAGSRPRTRTINRKNMLLSFRQRAGCKKTDGEESTELFAA